LVGKIQHGFIKGKLCLTYLISFCDEVTSLMDDGRAFDVVYLNFSKDFIIVSHNIIIGKMSKYRLDTGQ